MTKSIALIYASTSGNVETVMEKVAELCRAAGWNPTLYRAEKMPVEALKSSEYFVFGTSTWEHGVLNPCFQPLAAEMRKMDFSGKKAAFVGLGDMRYEPVLFCQGMLIVRELWLNQKGSEIGISLKINGEPYHQLESLVVPWANNVINQLPQ